VDWRVPLADAVQRIGPARRCRATWTPRWSSLLATSWPGKVREVLESGRAAEGHVFNLGHGVLPETDPDALLHVVELVHAGL
jgi:uroporphyrinogen decarboxylase